MSDIERLALPTDLAGLRALLEIQTQRAYECAVLDLTDAALKRNYELHDCPVVTFLSLLRNDSDFTRECIVHWRRRRET